jgi:hypothetical protein
MGNCSNRQGWRGELPAAVGNSGATDPKLDEEQRLALDALMRSTNAVSLFRGGAGTGKSFVLRELVRQVQLSGKRVVVLAPQRQQVVDMEQRDFRHRRRLRIFCSKANWPKAQSLSWTRPGRLAAVRWLICFAWHSERNARVILSGDTRQHGAVEASDALLAIERYSGVKPVELHTIRRQDPALGRSKRESSEIRQYRKAVEMAAAGKLAESFERLDKMGAVVSCGFGEQADKLADEYRPADGRKVFRRGRVADLGVKSIASTQRCGMHLKERDCSEQMM